MSLPDGLSDAAKMQLSSHLAFWKGQRDRLVGSVEAAVEDTKSNILDDILSAKDVEALLDDALLSLKDVVQEHADRSGHMAVACAGQLIGQAAQQGAIISADLARLEDAGTLGAVQQLVDFKAPLAKKQTLASIGGAGSGMSAAMQLQELADEKNLLEERCQTLQKQLSELLAERSSWADQVSALKAKADSSGAALGEDVAQMARALESKNAELSTLRSDMTKKLNETPQFTSMKDMLKKKNAQIAELRQKLKKYEPEEDDD